MKVQTRDLIFAIPAIDGSSHGTQIMLRTYEGKLVFLSKKSDL